MKSVLRVTPRDLRFEVVDERETNTVRSPVKEAVMSVTPKKEGEYDIYVYICRERKSEGAEKREKERKGEIEIERETERGER